MCTVHRPPHEIVFLLRRLRFIVSLCDQFTYTALVVSARARGGGSQAPRKSGGPHSLGTFSVEGPNGLGGLGRQDSTSGGLGGLKRQESLAASSGSGDGGGGGGGGESRSGESRSGKPEQVKAARATGSAMREGGMLGGGIAMRDAIGEGSAHASRVALNCST